MRSSGRSATSGSRLFISMRRAASCCQPRQERVGPRGARMLMRAMIANIPGRIRRRGTGPGSAVIVCPPMRSPSPRGRGKVSLAVALLVLAAHAGCIMSVDVLALTEKAKKAQKEAATGRPVDLEAWEPAELQLPVRRDATVTPFRVRVYADEEYRLANLRWQERIGHLLSDASAQLEGSFGAKLSIESVHPWKRQGAKNSTQQL